jgi:hypothetical protein
MIVYMMIELTYYSAIELAPYVIVELVWVMCSKLSKFSIPEYTEFHQNPKSLISLLKHLIPIPTPIIKHNPHCQNRYHWVIILLLPMAMPNIARILQNGGARFYNLWVGDDCCKLEIKSGNQIPKRKSVFTNAQTLKMLVEVKHFTNNVFRSLSQLLLFSWWVKTIFDTDKWMIGFNAERASYTPESYYDSLFIIRDGDLLSQSRSMDHVN